MRKIALYLIMLFVSFQARSNNDTLTVYYYENFPFSYTESGTTKGIEIDILKEYAAWLKNTKDITVTVNYKAFADFKSFFNASKTGDRTVVGLGSVTITQDREKEIAFSAPYLKNMAVLITDGKVPTLKSKTDISKAFIGMTAVAVSGSTHSKYLNDIKKTYMPGLQIYFNETEYSVIESIVANPKSFGYVDVVVYWSFLKKNKNKFLKIQKEFTQEKEEFGFILPKGGKHLPNLNEFFESGFGFTSTKQYHQILERYLGSEIISSVEIN